MFRDRWATLKQFYGFRVARALVIGLMLAAIWLLVVWPRGTFGKLRADLIAGVPVQKFDPLVASAGVAGASEIRENPSFYPEGLYTGPIWPHVVVLAITFTVVGVLVARIDRSLSRVRSHAALSAALTAIFLLASISLALVSGLDLYSLARTMTSVIVGVVLAVCATALVSRHLRPLITPLGVCIGCALCGLVVLVLFYQNWPVPAIGCMAALVPGVVLAMCFGTASDPKKMSVHGGLCALMFTLTAVGITGTIRIGASSYWEYKDRINEVVYAEGNAKRYASMTDAEVVVDLKEQFEGSPLAEGLLDDIRRDQPHYAAIRADPAGWRRLQKELAWAQGRELLFSSFLVALTVPIALVPVTFVRLREGLSEHSTLRSWFKFGKGASARWAGPAALARYAAASPASGVYVGESTFTHDFESRPITIQDNVHMLTVGMTGSGKSTTVIWPNLASYAGSVIILDPKGEHARMTLGRRQAVWGIEEKNGSIQPAGRDDLHPDTGTGTHGVSRVADADRLHNGRAFMLDPFGTVECYRSARYNPLSEVDLNGPDARKIIEAVADGCVIPEGDKNLHWTEGTKKIIAGFIAHVLSAFPPECHHLPFVYDRLMGLDEHGRASNETLEAFLNGMRRNGAAGGLCYEAATVLGESRGESLGSFKTTLVRSLSWIGDPSMRRQLSASDFRFSDVGEPGQPMTVYIVLPLGYEDSQSRWLRVMTAVSLSLVRDRPNRGLAKPDIPVLFVLDEFPTMGGKLDVIEKGLVTLRDARIKLWIFVQKFSQLKSAFGENWSVVPGSSTVQVFGVANDNADTAAFVSELLGQRAHSAPLLTPREVIDTLGKNADRTIVFPTEGLPMLLRRTGYVAYSTEGKSFNATGHLSAACFDEHLRRK